MMSPSGGAYVGWWNLFGVFAPTPEEIPPDFSKSPKYHWRSAAHFGHEK